MKTWMLLVCNDGEHEITFFPEEWLAWEALIDGHHEDLYDWLEDLSVDVLKNRVAALFGEDKEAILEALSSAGIDASVQHITLTGAELEK